MSDSKDIDVRGLDADDRRRAHDAARLLRACTVGGDPRAIFEALRPCAPIAGGLIGVMGPATSESLVGHVVALPSDVMAAWARTPPPALGQMMAPLVRASPGALISDRQAITGSFRERLALLGALEGAGLGESAGYKVAVETSPAGRPVHHFLTLALDDCAVFTPAQRVMFRCLHPAISDALARLSVPLVPHGSFETQIIETARTGYLLLTADGALLEFNARACELAPRYAADAKIELGRDWLARFAERAVAETRGGGEWRLMRDDRCARMAVRAHHLATSSHAIAKDSILLAMQEMEFGLPPRDLTRRQREVAVLMVTTGLSYKEMASTLDLSPRTVEGYAQAVLSAYDVRTRDELRALVR